MAEEGRYLVEKVFKACTMLDEIAASENPMKVTDIARSLDISFDVAFRYLNTLLKCGYVEQGKDGGYAIGPQAAKCWKAYRQNQKRAISRAQQALKETAITEEKKNGE